MSDLLRVQQAEQALEAERNVLSRMMVGTEHIEAAGELSPGDFQLDSHRRIVTAVRAIYGDGRIVDLGTLAAELGRRRELEAIGGRSYLVEICDSLHWNSPVPTAQYVGVVKKAAAGRSIIALAESIQSRVASGEDPETVLHTLLGHVSAIEAAAVRVQAAAHLRMRRGGMGGSSGGYEPGACHSGHPDRHP